MLQEEAFHLLTGNSGLMRIVKAGVIPSSIIQKYLNKWISTAHDLFGQDESSTAYWAYLWGLKGRYDEHLFDGPPDMNAINDISRNQYHKEVSAIIDSLNKNLKPGQEPLVMPDMKFNRSVGKYAGQPYSVKGELLSQEEYEKHKKDVVPSEADVQYVINLEKEKAPWIVDPNLASAPAR